MLRVESEPRIGGEVLGYGGGVGSAEDENQEKKEPRKSE